MCSAFAESWLTETPAHAGEGLSVHALARLGEQDVSDPGASSGRLPGEVFVSAGDLCSCCWLWRLKSCDCFRLLAFVFFKVKCTESL